MKNFLRILAILVVILALLLFIDATLISAFGEPFFFTAENLQALGFIKDADKFLYAASTYFKLGAVALGLAFIVSPEGASDVFGRLAEGISSTVVKIADGVATGLSSSGGGGLLIIGAVGVGLWLLANSKKQSGGTVVAPVYASDRSF